MNANRLISMALNMIMRRVMRAGINAGADALSKRGKGGTQDQDGQPAKGAPNSRKAQQRMRQSVRMGRRMGRF